MRLKPFFLAFISVFSFSYSYLCPAISHPQQQAFVQSAKAVLDGNWVPSMNSTLPSPNLYPHQWSWDSAFIAIGYSHFNTRKAIDETDALFRAQWSNGLLPHIVFNPNADESYFPGPAFWKIDTSESHPLEAQTSGIVQPPVHAIASLAIYNNARSIEQKKLAYEHLRNIYPKLVKWHSYLYNNRDPLGEHLVFIRHMWESGMDNSPAWDDALNAIHLSKDEIPHYTRVDKGKVAHHKERPNSHFYDRAVYLIKIFYESNYDEYKIFKRSPFIIQDVLFNSILVRAGEALGDIASILDKTEEGVNHQKQAAQTASAMSAKLYDSEDGFFYDYDMVKNNLIRSKISGGLAALYGAKIDESQLNSLMKHLHSDGFLGADLSSWTIPSVSREDAGYTNSSYWKGPAWLNINYLVRDGLIRNANGRKDVEKVAKFLKDRSIEMVSKMGFYEYFNPISGDAHGGLQFSWSAALSIDWICTSQKDGSTGAYWNTALTLMTVVCSCLVALWFAGSAAQSRRRKRTRTSTDLNTKEETRTIRKRSPQELRRADALATRQLRPRARDTVHRGNRPN